LLARFWDLLGWFLRGLTALFSRVHSDNPNF
jgi:hypothetical protein